MTMEPKGVNPSPSKPVQPAGQTLARAALMMAVLSLSLLCLGGVGALLGFPASVGAWVTAMAVLGRGAEAPVRHTARMALITAIGGTLFHGLLLILSLASQVKL